MTAPEKRAPKQDRSRLTRERLLGASIDLLATQGWAATTVGAVAAAAGVSRGAAQHHFPTREDLITAALGHMIEQRLEDVRRVGLDLPEPGPERTVAVVRLIVQHYTSDLFKAALHVWTAAASDPALRDRVLPFETHMSREVLVIAAEALGYDPADLRVRRPLQATLDLARGLGLADVLSDDSARREKVIRYWAETLDLMLAQVPAASDRGLHPGRVLTDPHGGG
ncbi:MULTISPECIES: TetR/AcrR family transcriptional regulator [unclassified Dietzia]|uniref:TetR/AcrR family transcriptional regulator n=1 Tax=unclassified Dietzia TaxID=2617939 RepID=UPI000D220668|nr:MULTISPECIES: TetR/AcrR family transcriptional regulator [unclassified Dietzia]AVZ40074.1 TetR family transcriptional regulator [Dietzia sp. JS16-p6b]QGW25492.1 transcriptional regulator, TetR family protein [Dietzia sp. DQ12-45-1b]